MKYKIIKHGLNLPDSKIGDIVDMNDGASILALERDMVELCEDQNARSKHVIFLASPIDIKLKVNQLN